VTYVFISITATGSSSAATCTHARCNMHSRDRPVRGCLQTYGGQRSGGSNASGCNCIAWIDELGHGRTRAFEHLLRARRANQREPPRNPGAENHYYGKSASRFKRWRSQPPHLYVLIHTPVLIHSVHTESSSATAPSQR
jgi:hypothetical protein